MSDKQMVDVIATAEGFDGAAIRTEGEKFQMPEGSTGSWYKPVGKATGGGNTGGPASTGPTAKEVIATLPALSDEELEEVLVNEDDREGEPRKSVVDAVVKEQTKRKAEAEAAAKAEAEAKGGGGEGAPLA